MATEFIIKNGYFSQGSSNVTGSLTVTAGVTASLQGTASFATSASNALTASFVNPLQQDVLITGSLIVSASGGTNDFRVGTNKLFVSASGNVGIGITSSAAKLHINNTGTGNSFLIEDSANPDTTPFVIDNAGRVLIGGLTPLDFVVDNSNSTASLYVKGNPSFGPSTDYAMYINGNSCDVGLGITYGFTPTTTGIDSAATNYGGKFQATNQGAVTIYGIFAESAAFIDEFSSPLDVAVGGFFNATQAVNGIGISVQSAANSINTGSLILTNGSSAPNVGIQNHTGGGNPNLGIRNEVTGIAATGSYTTVSGSSSGMVGDIISVTGPGSNYALQLQDGTEGAGKVLVSQTATGKANWSTRLSGSYTITGSLTVSGSSTFTYIGPANFTGSLGVTGSTNLIGGVNVHNKYYFINTLNDLPTPSSGVITLADNVTYFFTTTVDLNGNRLVCGRNTTILGASSENSRIKSTGLTGTPLISSSYSIPMRGITIEADVALRLDASGSNEAIDWFGVNFTDCPTVGLIKNYSNVIWTDCAFLESANCTFDGTIGTVGFVTCLFNGRSGQTIMSVSPTGSITRRFRPVYSSFIALSGETALNVPTSSIANAEGYILDTCNFSGGGTYLSGSNTGSLKSLFVNNVGIPNTTNAGHYYMINNTTDTTIGVSNVNVYVKAAGTTTIGVGNSPKWTQNGFSNRIVYSGSISQDFRFSAVGTVQSSAANQVISVAMAKNGTVQTESEVTVRTATANQPYPFAIQDLTPIAFGDYVEVFVANTNSTNVRVGDLNVIIDKIGS